MQPQKTLLAVALGLAMSQVSYAETDLVEKIKEGDFIGDFRLRYETNDTEGGTDAATALTLRSRLGYETPSVSGFKVLAEIEDVRAFIDEYRVEDPDYDVVADPVNTEINRAQISYAKDEFSAVVGRQRIILDNARFVGNVGWRQNEQTYDAALFAYKKDAVSLAYAYVDQVNDITFTSTDVTAHVLNGSYAGLPVGTVTGYAYLIEDDETEAKLDTYGASLVGKQTVSDVAVSYRAEVATQSTDDYDALYYVLEAGATLSGVTATLGNEVLGSDDGDYGFATPLATKHAFNGWADLFLATPAVGLSDTYVSVGGAVAGVKLLAAYHDFEADEGSMDFGSEVDFLAAKGINQNFSVGVKYAAYSAGDDASGKADTDKLWVWGEAKF